MKVAGQLKTWERFSLSGSSSKELHGVWGCHATTISLIFSSLKQGSDLDGQNHSLDFPGKEILWAKNTQGMTLGGLEKDGNCSLLCLHSQYEICKLETFGKQKFCTSNFFYNFWGIIKVIQFFRFIHLNFFWSICFCPGRHSSKCLIQSCFAALPEHGEGSTQNYY